MSRNAKLCSIFLAAILASAGLLYILGYYLEYKVNGFVIGLAGKISKKIGHPVTIKSVTTKWDWLYLKINVADMLILDKDTNVPLFMVQDLIGTVDALDSILTLSPKFKHILLQSPRLALQWDATRTPQILGLDGGSTQGQVDPAMFLQLLALQRSVSVVNGDFHIQGAEGADLPLMNVKLDYRQRSKQEYNIVIMGNVAAALQPEFNFAMNYNGILGDYTKAMIDFEIKTNHMQIENINTLFPRQKQDLISGSFADLDVKGTIQNGLLRVVKAEFTIDDLDLNNNTTVTSGSGSIEFQPTKNFLSMNLSKLQFRNKQLFTHAIQIDSISGDIQAEQTGEQWQFKCSPNIKLRGIELNAEISVAVLNKKLHSLQFASKVHDAHVDQVLPLIPDQKVGPAMLRWLKHSLLDGKINYIQFSIDDSNKYFQLDLQDSVLKYSTAWPSIDAMDASVILDDSEIYIDAKCGTILGHPINAIMAKFVPFDGKANSKVFISGNMDATLEAGLEFLNLTPLKASVADKIVNFNPTGPMHLQLDLDVDISTAVPKTQVYGILHLQQAAIHIPDVNVPLSTVAGIIDFTNDSFDAKNLSLQLFDQPAVAHISMLSGKQRGMQIKITAPLKMASIHRAFPKLPLDNVTGTTNIAAELEIPWGKTNADTILTIKSDLVGIGLNYPAPLYKAPAEKSALQLKYYIKDPSNHTVYLKFSNWLDAYIFIKDAAISGGHISLGTGKALLATQNNLYVSGKLANFDWDIWNAWLKNSPKLSAVPLEIDVFIAALKFQGEQYNDIWIKYDASSKIFVLESPVISGAILYAPEDDKIDIKLDKLELGTTRLKDNAFIKSIKDNKSKQLPLIQFYCEKLLYNNTEFRKVNLQLLPRTYGYEISDLAISNDNILLQAQGQWQMDGKEFTQLSGNAYTKNFGKVLHDWDYGNSISKGTGEINFSLQWDGNPTQFNILNLEGASHFQLQSGTITGVNPGLGRVIGLLSLDSIQRRLQLDFSDIVSKGYVFDKLECDIKFQPGFIASDNIMIHSPSSKIELTGKADLKTHELDFNMDVTAKSGMGIPVAVALAVGNPILGAGAGAGLWLFDQASGSKLSQISTAKYKVTGTWDAPKIDEVVAEKASKK